MLLKSLICLLAFDKTAGLPRHDSHESVEFQYAKQTENEIGTTFNIHRRRLSMKIEGFGYVCTDTETDKIAGQFRSFRSNCPKRNWLPHFVYSIENDIKKAVVIIIGCNKGDDWVAVMNEFSGNSTYDVNVYHSNVLKYIQAQTGRVRRNAYACLMDNQKRHVKMGEIIKPVRAYCVEPTENNIRLLRTVTSGMKFDTSTAIIAKVAMNSYNGVADFPKNVSIGSEVTGLNDNLTTTDAEPDYVKMRNLDTFVLENLSPSDVIDFVSVDTEGYDSEVILGFVRTLVNRYVRCIEFEYHENRRWRTADLQTVITLLDLLTFDCYFQGNKGQLWRLTGCWHENYNTHMWSNVVCINRREKSHEWFVKESHKYMSSKKSKSSGKTKTSDS